jgi:hypothetical protein
MNRIPFFLLGGICAFMLLTIRTGEHLACFADSSSQVTCDRIQRRLFYNSASHFRVRDATTFALHLGGGGGGRTSVRSTVIEARDTAGRRVVVLNIPERNVAYASDLERRLRALPAASPPTLLFDRDERRGVGLLVGGLAAFWLAILALRQFRRAPSPRHL